MTLIMLFFVSRENRHRNGFHKNIIALSQTTRSCMKCGENNHVTFRCRHRSTITCWSCGNAGHKQENFTVFFQGHGNDAMSESRISSVSMHIELKCKCNRSSCICNHFITTPDHHRDEHSPTLRTGKLAISEIGLVIGHLNIQGVCSKLDELNVLLATNKIDIFGITETKLKDTHPTDSFVINNYQIPFRKDRSANNGGGILVYIRNNLTCIRREDIEDPDLESIWVEIKQPNSKSFLICIMYRPPDSRVIWKDHFEANIEKVQVEEKEILILGDFNKDLNNVRLKKEWENYTTSLGLHQLVYSSTRECNTSKTLIDHIYTDTPQNIVSTSVPKLGLSDHYPIFC